MSCSSTPSRFSSFASSSFTPESSPPTTLPDDDGSWTPTPKRLRTSSQSSFSPLLSQKSLNIESNISLDLSKGIRRRVKHPLERSRGGVLDLLQARSMSSTSSPTWSRLMPTNKFLKSFISHDELDTFHHAPGHSDSMPFCIAYSNGSKRLQNRKPPILAVGTSEGIVHLYNTDRTASNSPAPIGHINPHTNSIFHVLWSPSDSLIVTSAGDQRAKVTDVERNVTLSCLASAKDAGEGGDGVDGHKSTVRTAVWIDGDPNMLATCSRDGHIMLWDLRESSRYSAFNNNLTNNRRRFSPNESADILKPSLVIQNAHTNRYAPRISKWQSKTSLTSLLSLPPSGNPFPLLSGAADGLVKLWDVRLVGNTKLRHSYEKKYPECVASEAIGRSVKHGSKRVYGIIDLVGKEGRVHALTMNSRIVTFSPHQMSVQSHRSHPSLQTCQFYFRLSLSPSGRHLAAGSANGTFVTFDVESDSSLSEEDAKGIAFVGHEGRRDVGYVDWGGEETLASVGDDEMVRIWRADPFVLNNVKRPNYTGAEGCQDDDDEEMEIF